MGNVKVYDESTGTIQTIGEFNKQEIFQFLFKRTEQKKATKVNDIRIFLNHRLSRQTIDHHLQSLVREHRIYKTKSGYLAENTLRNDILKFCTTMKDKYVYIFDYSTMVHIKEYKDKLGTIPRIQSLYKYPGFQIPNEASFPIPFPQPNDYLTKSLSGSILSDDICELNDQKTDHEKFLFEFANRVGAYLVYIFLESLRPIKKSDLKSTSRKEVALDVLSEAIDVPLLFREFKRFIINTGMIAFYHSDDEKRLSDQKYRDLFELNDKTFHTLSKVFTKTYPYLYHGLENWWFNTRKLHLEFDKLHARTNFCSHKWEEYNLYKFGECLKCKKCQLLIQTKQHKQKKRKN